MNATKSCRYYTAVLIFSPKILLPRIRTDRLTALRVHSSSATLTARLPVGQVNDFFLFLFFFSISFFFFLLFIKETIYHSSSVTNCWCFFFFYHSVYCRTDIATRIELFIDRTFHSEAYYVRDVVVDDFD